MVRLSTVPDTRSPCSSSRSVHPSPSRSVYREAGSGMSRRSDGRGRPELRRARPLTARLDASTTSSRTPPPHQLSTEPTDAMTGSDRRQSLGPTAAPPSPASDRGHCAGRSAREYPHLGYLESLVFVGGREVSLLGTVPADAEAVEGSPSPGGAYSVPSGGGTPQATILHIEVRIGRTAHRRHRT